jgi:hypothetical protein
MSRLSSDSRAARSRFPSVARRVAWLRWHRGVVVTLTVAGVAAAFVLDLVIPGYAIAGFYLFPIMLVALALRERLAIAVSALCLALTVYVMVLQGRANGENILLIFFGVLGGAGLIALSTLFNRVDELYETERSSTARLQFLTAQLQALQEVSMAVVKLLDSQAILDQVVRSGAELLDAQCVVVTRDGPAVQIHAAYSPGTDEGEEPLVGTVEAWLSPPVREGASAVTPQTALSGDRILRVPVDADLLGVGRPGVEACMIFARRSGVPGFSREDETLAGTLGTLLSAGLGRGRLEALR